MAAMSSYLRRCSLLGLLALLALCSGCLEETVLIHVKKDGSGYVRLRYLRVPVADAPTLTQEGLAAAAATMGEGVSFLRAKPITSGDQKGFLAEYLFTDITKLRLEGLDAALPVGGRPLSKARYRFEFAAGEVPTLTVLPTWEGATPDTALPTADAAALAGVTISVYLQVDGEVQTQNAAYRSTTLPNAFTLLYFNANQYAASSGDVNRLIQTNGPTAISEYLAAKFPGLRMEDPNAHVTISFK
jgi:hypothetical protein